MGEQIVAQKARVSWPFIPARSLRRSTSCCDRATSAIGDETHEEVEHSAPFPFAFLFAFSVPR